MSPECLKDQVLSFAETLVVNQQKKISLLSSVLSRVLDEYIQSIHIHRHVFRSSQDSSVWLMLTSREQPMSPECSKYQVLSFAKMLVVWWTNKKYSVLISVLQSAQWINSERISTTIAIERIKYGNGILKSLSKNSSIQWSKTQIVTPNDHLQRYVPVEFLF